MAPESDKDESDDLESGLQFARQVDRQWHLAAIGGLVLDSASLLLMQQYVADRGFDLRFPRGRGRYKGLTTDHVHYRKHAIDRQEWTTGTTFEEFMDSIRLTVLEAHGIYAHTYEGEWAIGFLRRSGDSRGNGGGDWIAVQYDLSLGRLLTAYQIDEPLELFVTRKGVGNLRWIKSVEFTPK